MSALPNSGKPRLTPKQEKFTNAYIETGNASEAARQAYDVKTDAAAGQIGYENLKKLEVAEAIQVKQASIQKRNELTVDSIVAEFEDLQIIAVEKNQLNVAATALTNKAKVAGLWVERTEDVTNRPATETLDEFIDSGALKLLLKRYRERVESGEPLEPLE